MSTYLLPCWLFSHFNTMILTSLPSQSTSIFLLPSYFQNPFLGNIVVCQILGGRDIDIGLMRSPTQSCCLISGEPWAYTNIFCMLFSNWLSNSYRVFFQTCCISLIPPLKPLALHYKEIIQLLSLPRRWKSYNIRFSISLLFISK